MTAHDPIKFKKDILNFVVWHETNQKGAFKIIL